MDVDIRSEATRLLLQPDWNEGMGSGCSKFWAGCQKKDEESVYTNVHTNADWTALNLEDGRFIAKLNNNRKLELEYSFGSGGSVRSRFVPSSVVFDKIHSSNIASLDVSSGGLGVSTCGSGLAVWKADSGSVQKQFKEAHLLDVNRCRFFPSGLVILSCGSDMMLKIWSVEYLECVRELKGHKQGVTSAGFVDRGAQVVSCSRDGTARLWDLSTSSCIRTLAADLGPLDCLSIASSSLRSESDEAGEKLVAVGGDLGKCSILSLRSGELVREYDAKSGLHCVELVEDHWLMLGTESGAFHVVDLRQPRFSTAVDIQSCRSAFVVSSEMRGALLSLAVGVTGVVCGYSDGTICLWPRMAPFPGAPAVEFSASDCDPIRDIRLVGSDLFVASRDGKIRKYQKVTV